MFWSTKEQFAHRTEKLQKKKIIKNSAKHDVMKKKKNSRISNESFMRLSKITKNLSSLLLYDHTMLLERQTEKI